MSTDGSSAGGGGGADASVVQCHASGVSDYDQPLNVAAVFIILAASLLGTSLPLLFKRYPRLLRWPFLIIIGKHIGTGVLIALALIHLLGPAVQTLSDECLTSTWVNYQYAALFAMLAALAMHLIETSVLEYTIYSKADAQGGGGGGGGGPAGHPELRSSSSELELLEMAASPSSHVYKRSGGDEEAAAEAEAEDGDGKPTDGAAGLTSPTASILPSSQVASSDAQSYPGDPVGMKAEYQAAYHSKHQVALASSRSPSSSSSSSLSSRKHELELHHQQGEVHAGHSHGVLLSSGVERTVGAYILEFGLTAHSVIVGITVGVASHSELVSLIPALSFHQFFEGFALGARLASVGFTGCNELLLTLIYSLSAPLGIAIGIGIASSYEANSPTALLTQGSFDSISAGILLYVAFVQMLAQEFSTDYKNCGRNGLKKISLYAGLYLGAGVMAVIGRWL